MPYSVSATGATIKDADEIFADMSGKLLAAPEYPDDMQLEDASVVGRFLRIAGESIAEVGELFLTALGTFDRDNAEGVQLDDLNGLIGVPREAAAFSKGTVRLVGTPTTVITAGSQVKLENVDGSEATIDAPATIGGGGFVDATFTADATGPKSFPDGATLQILTPISGWDSASVYEPVSLAWALGRDIEEDSEYRRRSEESTAIMSEGTDSGIAANVRARPDVGYAFAKSNRALATDADGIPGKAVRLVIYPGGVDSDALASLYFALLSAGIRPDGDVEVTVTDSEGQDHTMRYAVAQEVEIWVEVDVTTEDGYGGDAAVENAILAYGASLDPADKVKPLDMGELINDTVPGVCHLVIRVQRDGAPAATDTTPVDISVLEKAVFDAARVTVAVV